MNERINTTVPSRMKPVICLKVSIQAPGFGRKRSNSGNTPINTYGLAMPRPSVPNTMSVVVIDCVTAQAMALAMNGPVQGVASTVVIAPFDERAEGSLLGGHVLDRAAAKEAGDRNLPHAQQAQSHRKHDGRQRHGEPGAAELTAPGETNPRGQESPTAGTPTTMPAEYQRLSTSACVRLCPDCCTKLITLSPITGSTQGIRLRMMPPTNASTM